MLFFAAAGISFAAIWGLKAYVADNALVSLAIGVLHVMGYIAGLIATFQLAVNIFNSAVCGAFTLLFIRPVRYAFFAGLAALVPSGFYFETALSWFLGGVLPAAATGAVIGLLRDRQRK